MNTTPPKKSGPSNLMVRVGAAAVMVPTVLFITWRGGVWFNLFIAGLGVLMALEWTKIVHASARWQQVLHILAALTAVGSVYSAAPGLAVLVIAAIWIASMICKSSDNGITWPLLGVPYIAAPLMALVWLRGWLDLQAVRPAHDMPDLGLVAVLTLFAAVWSADSLAYFAGRGLGGPKLWPSVSPNKTWAGFWGAVVGGLLGAVVVFWLAGAGSLLAGALLGAAIGGLEQGGDLLESAVKRKFDVKDSGSIIPGHGGVLDRVDGLIAASVAAWIFGAWRAGWFNAAVGFVSW
jgi:phosphatidate cytidylyltransferase